MKIAEEAAKLKAITLGKGQSISALCRSANISRSTWERLMIGDIDPKISTVERLKRAAATLPSKPPKTSPASPKGE